MTEPTIPPDPPSNVDVPVRNLRRKAKLLLISWLLLLTLAVVYLLYARGLFESTQRLTLVAEDAEGVVVGMDMTFAGFAIGRVARIELADDGNARILIDVPTKDARWLRKSSVFTMERGLVGGTRIRAFSGLLDDPPLEDGAVRPILRGDALAELPRMTASAREMLENLKALTASDAALMTTLTNVQQVTDKLKGPQGGLGVLLGNEQEARKFVERTNALLARADRLAARLDKLVAGADRQLLGEASGQGGLVGDARTTVRQLNGLLDEARGSLKKVDHLLVKAEEIAGHTSEATVDLLGLRSEVEVALRKIDHLVNEINRKWPLARDTEIKLP
ncbi:MAG: mammalian cell entry protein [Candidatus Accumulibacter sp.]|nr:mammalian cell entry protein [Accumulibacter sp.]